MRAKFVLSLSLLSFCLVSVPVGRAQDSNANRKVLLRSAPAYPEIAKKMNLSGTVKLIAVVEPDGKVKTVEAMGGSPVLIQAAKDAIARWKFAPGGTETREVVELHFAPQTGQD